jgi:Protein of unknown function (DUF2568)
VSVTLLSVRFVWEIALLIAWAYVVAGLVDSAVGQWVVGGLAVVVVAGVWSVFLSPRRRLDLPLALRTVMELVLFGGAAVGLVAAGAVTAGLVLVVGEAASLVGLWALGLPPGSDAATEL